MTHPNAELVRRLFGAFGNDAKQISATFDREVVEFLRRTGLETGGTYRSQLQRVLADDDWAVAIYRAQGSRNGIDLDVDQALVIRIRDGQWADVTAVPLDSNFDAFWS